MSCFLQIIFLPLYFLQEAGHSGDYANIQNSSSYMFKRLEMDLTILLIVLSLSFFIILFGMNLVNSLSSGPGVVPSPGAEGFEVQEIESQIRAILDPMNSEELCPLFTTIRANMAKNEKAGQDITDAEAAKRVEAELSLKISGGALPCPLLRYPKAGSTDLEWLDFLQKVPSDFGARVVLMAVYAQGFLSTTETTLKLALSGNGTPPEGFTICSPDVADSRRAEASASAKGECTLPEDLTPAQIKEGVTTLLKKLVANKTTILKSKQIDPAINIKPLITQAKASAVYITQKSQQAQDGSLQMDGPIKMQDKA